MSELRTEEFMNFYARLQNIVDEQKRINEHYPVVCEENDRLRAALEWYADPENYRDQSERDGDSLAWEDAGKRARTALASDKGGA